MPWEASKLISAALSAQGVVGELQQINGGLGRSVFQPEWDGMISFMFVKILIVENYKRSIKLLQKNQIYFQFCV